jgi:hypothetical protein
MSALPLQVQQHLELLLRAPFQAHFILLPLGHPLSAPFRPKRSLNWLFQF